MSGHGRQLEWRSTRTTIGDFRVLLTNESAETATYGVRVTRVPFTPSQVKLDDLLAKFAAADIQAEHAPSLQRKTIFDELYDTEVAEREILHIEEPQNRVDVYIFADEQTALDAAETIEPGASYLVLRDGESVDVVPLPVAVGGVPLWWHEGPFLLYTTSSKSEVEERVTAALGDPLGSASADVVRIRFNNRTALPLADVRIISGGGEIVLPELLPGMSGYQMIESNEPFEIGTQYQSQLSRNRIAGLAAGDYLIDIAVAGDEIIVRPFNDRDYYAAADLVEQNWLWQYTELVDGSRFVPVSADIEPSYLRFRTDTTPNMGEAGRGNMGCNGMGGNYFANGDQQLLMSGVGSNSMLCGEEAMESEYFWADHAPTIYRYEIYGDTLRLFATGGSTFVFEKEGAITVENRIYRSIFSGWGGDVPVLVVAESNAGRPGATNDDIRDRINGVFGHLSEDMVGDLDDTISNFLETNSAPADLTEEFTLDENVIVISSTELGQLFAEGAEAGWMAIADQYDGAQIIFSFSQPSFNDSGDQVLVYYSIRQGDSYLGYYAFKFDSGDNWDGGMSSLAWDSED